MALVSELIPLLNCIFKIEIFDEFVGIQVQELSVAFTTRLSFDFIPILLIKHTKLVKHHLLRSWIYDGGFGFWKIFVYRLHFNFTRQRVHKAEMRWKFGTFLGLAFLSNVHAGKFDLFMDTLYDKLYRIIFLLRFFVLTNSYMIETRELV